MKVEYAANGPGQCVLHNIDGRLHVERADPQVLLPEFTLGDIRAGRAHPDLRLSTLRGDHLLVISAANGEVTYRLADFDGPSMSWVGTRLT